MASQKIRDFRDRFRGKNNPKPQQKHLSSIQPQQKNNPLSNEAISEKVFIYRGSILDDEITNSDVEAVVNPANERLWAYGSGVCGVIFNSAGYDKLQQACNAITAKTDDDSIPNGQTAVTPSYNISNINYILHTIAPCEQNNENLISCYTSILELCILVGITSVALPCIGTGDGNFSKQSACSVALRSVRGWLADANNVKYKHFIETFKPKQWHSNIIEEQKNNDPHIYIDEEESVADRIKCVIFCCFDEENWNLYNTVIPKIYPSSNNTHSYLWMDRMMSMEYEDEISNMVQHIQSLEMENKQLKSGNMEQEDELQDTEHYTSSTTAIERIYNEFNQVKDDFARKYNHHNFAEITKSSANYISANKDILKYTTYLQKFKEANDEFIDNVEDIKQCLSTMSTPDTSEYKQWSVDDIIVWILLKDTGTFAPYIELLKCGLISSEITSGEYLPQLTRSDLSVPPFSINSFPVKRKLIQYFQSLKEENDAEGNDTNV